MCDIALCRCLCNDVMVCLSLLFLFSITARQALRHPYFRQVREQERRNKLRTANATTSPNMYLINNQVTRTLLPKRKSTDKNHSYTHTQAEA